MWAAVQDGDTQKLAELMKKDHNFHVNMDWDGNGWTLLHSACVGDSRSAVIPLLLAYPDIDVNAKDKYGYTPFNWACYHGRPSCVREMLKDFRVKVDEPDDDGETPLWVAAGWGHVNIIKVWIASGREMDLGTPGDVDKTDAIGATKKIIESWYNEATKRGKTEAATLLERFKENPSETRHAVRVELGLLDALAAETFALVVFVSDGLLQVNDTTTAAPATRFFSVVRQLPLELQMVVCHYVVGSSKEIILGKDSEVAFKELARKFL